MINKFMNKYEKWYNDIIDKGKIHRPLLKTERHHIIPECFFKDRVRKGPAGWLDGNPNDPANLVYLTGREHFICHWLLTKIHTGIARRKMINAMYMMQAGNDLQDRYQTKITSRIYQKLREEYAEYISKQNTGRIQPPEEKARQLKSQVGRKRAPFSEEWLANIKAARQGERNGMYGKTHSEETRSKQSEKAKGRKYSAETVEKRAAKIRGSKRQRLTCPYCGRDSAVNTYPRWHGDQCKERNSAK